MNPVRQAHPYGLPLRQVRKHGQPRIDDPARTAFVAALGMDETAWLRATRDHHTLYVAGLVDTATGWLLDVMADRTASGDALAVTP